MSTPDDNQLPQRRRRVFLVDDHPLVREWLGNVINQQPDLIVCGESEGREGCLDAIEKKRPDIVVVDLSLKDCSGFDLIAQIKQHSPNIGIIVLSMYETPLHVRRAFRAGATGYVLKSETTRNICFGIRDVLDGTSYISQQAAPLQEGATPPEEVDLTLLSDREREIFRLFGLGNSTRQIAQALNISIKTVQVHRGNIREKLGIHGVTELQSAAVRWNERHALDPDR